MALKVGQAFQRTSANPIDESFVLTKVQMLGVNENLMPDNYFCVCSDDGKFYTFDKSATPSAETGKFIEVGVGDLLDRTYKTKGAYNSLIQDCDEFIYPDSAAATYRVFMQSLATKGSRNVIDYCYEISFNDGADSVLVWLNVSEYKFDFGNQVTNRETYEAKDRNGNLVCYFYEVYRNATNGAWGIYFVASDKDRSAGGSSETLGNRIAKIEAYEPKTVYRVSGYVADDYDFSGIGELDTTEQEINEIFSRVYGEGAVTQEHYDETAEVLIGTYKAADGTVYDLYRKVVDFGALPNAAEKTVAYGITNYDKIVKVSGIAIQASGDVLPLPFANPADLSYGVALFVRQSSGAIVIRTGSNRSAMNGYITIEFTRARA